MYISILYLISAISKKTKCLFFHLTSGKWEYTWKTPLYFTISSPHFSSACFRRRMESPFVWNHVTLISHVKELIHKQGSDHAHAPSTTHVAHAAKSSVEGYVIPKDDGLVTLQDFINQMFGPMEQVRRDSEILVHFELINCSVRVISLFS